MPILCPMPRRVVLLAVPDAQVLDVTGPLEVFSTAGRELARRGRGEAPYRLELRAPRRGPLVTSSGLVLLPEGTLSELRGRVDTLVVAGGRGVQAALGDALLLRRLRALAPRVRRLASVCTGAYLLAEAGLLDGRRVTTHWAACADLAARYPRVQVDPDPIFVRDGRLYTSAGVTAGMDLALALVEEDLGRDLALAVARRLVLFLKRPGGQSQFSALLAAQQAARDGLAAVRDFVLEHPGEDCSVAALARRASMSPRHFARVFAREVGLTPARFVERARVEAARRQLEDSRGGVDEIAAGCGFGSAETLRRAFLRTLRVGPAEYRRRFQRAAAPAQEASA
jgi:transcriptional regulator GlxA family with amidase domain